MIHPLRGLSQTGGRSVESNSFEIQDEIQDEPLNKSYKTRKKSFVQSCVP